ncbi:hypothetical protein FHG71_14005, partial [Rubellimicrobium roseum]
MGDVLCHGFDRAFDLGQSPQPDGALHPSRRPSARNGSVDYTAQLDAALDRLHQEGRYRTF